jgi:dephospho-CoA kinase
VIRLGLTGSLGAGKSTVGRLLERRGAVRIDADLLARRAVEPGTEALARIRERFGDVVIAPDGSLDRAALRSIVFADREALDRLEAIVHPVVDRLRADELRAAETAGAGVAVIEIPLLLEKGLQDEFDAVVVVDAPEAIRRERVCGTRGITAAEFEAMDRAQWPPERKRAAADHVIWNAAGLDDLERTVDEVWDAVTGASDAYERRAGAPPVTWRVDLHAHTSASRDCLTSPADLVRAAREAGLDRIAVTDHDEIDGAFAAREVAPELVIVGEEVRTAEGLDLIGLFLERHIAPGADFRRTAEAIRAQGGVVYLPHPFDARRGTDEAFLAGVEDCVDAVEGINARVHDPERNARARSWALARGLPLGAGSDAHLRREVGAARCVVPPFDGPETFLASLRAGSIEGRASSPLVHVGSTWAKIWRRLSGRAS